ncbi:hypothetical protein DFJ74DRAFT_694750 [Hyaloraphidium curvatum]|nr:hypothetical protein DFJ74DRAFT_694750 [Hyaloraphidium curvatum]
MPTPLLSRPADLAFAAFFSVLFVAVTLVDGQVVYPDAFPPWARRLYAKAWERAPHPLQKEARAFYRFGIMGTAVFCVAPASAWLIRGLYLDSPAINLPGLVVSVHILTNMVTGDADVLFGPHEGYDTKKRLGVVGLHAVPYAAALAFAYRCGGRLLEGRRGS